MKKFIINIVLMFLLANIGFAQTNLERELRGFTPHEEIVSFSINLPFNQAIDLLSKVSEYATGKKINSLVERTDPIGLELTNLHYFKAFQLIVQYANLVYEEREHVIVVYKKDVPVDERTKDNYAGLESREVKISAVFFEIDTEEMRRKGINWEFLLGRTGAEASAGFSQGGSTQDGTGDQQVTLEGLGLGADIDFQVGSFFGRATALFNAFERNSLGEMIASPTITVRDRQLGRIQVGSDYSIKQRDFAGNLIDVFFSTGSIINVTPYVYNEDGIEYVLLQLNVERSSGIPDPVSTEIKKTTASTQVLMLDGEETIIGGLFTIEERVSRSGIPFLKDLPWWVLGIRYLTGYDEVSYIKKELVILIKADIVPTLRQRITNPLRNNIIEEEINATRDRIKFYKFNSNEIKE